MLGLSEKITVWDTELVSWEGALDSIWTQPGRPPEIIQIGAIRVETETFRELSIFTQTVKPVINPELSDFIIEMTGMTQSIIDKEGILFPEAFKKFSEWWDGSDLYSFGHFDAYMMATNCRIHKLSLVPFKFSSFFNIRELFLRYGYRADLYSSGRIMEVFGVKVPPNHDALRNTKSLIIGLRELARRVG